MQNAINFKLHGIVPAVGATHSPVVAAAVAGEFAVSSTRPVSALVNLHLPKTKRILLCGYQRCSRM